MIVLRQKLYKESDYVQTKKKGSGLRQKLADSVFYTKVVPSEVIDRRIRDAAIQGRERLTNMPENEELYNKASEMIRGNNIAIFDQPEQQSVLNYPSSHVIFKSRFPKEKNIEELESTEEGRKVLGAVNNSSASIYMKRPAPTGTATTLMHEYGHIQNSNKRPLWWRLKEPFMKSKELKRKHESLWRYIYSQEEALASRNGLKNLKNLGASKEYIDTSATALRAATVDPHKHGIRRNRAIKLYYRIKPSRSIAVPSDIEQRLIKSGKGLSPESQKEAVEEVIREAYEKGKYPYSPKPLKY